MIEFDPTNLSENDIQILTKVQKTPWPRYGEVCDLEDKCDSEYARRIVHDFCVSSYHREEAKAGMI